MNRQKLKQILDTVRSQKDLIPHDGETHCNIYVDRVMGLCGIPRIVNEKGSPLLANDMIDFMEEHWGRVTGAVAAARAAMGVLVIAGQCEALHGHVCPVYPSPMGYSASWRKEVPYVSNVGKSMGVMRVSQAFRTEPIYYSSPIKTITLNA